MAIANQSSVSQQSNLTTGSDETSARSVDPANSERFNAAIDSDADNNSGGRRPMAFYSQQLEDSLRDFRNGDISAEQLEQALIEFEQSLADEGIETGGTVTGDQFFVSSDVINAVGSAISSIGDSFSSWGGSSSFDESHVSDYQPIPDRSFLELDAQGQQFVVESYLDQHQPEQIYGDRLSQALSSFLAQQLSGQELEQALIDFDRNLNESGVETSGNVVDGEFVTRSIADMAASILSAGDWSFGGWGGGRHDADVSTQPQRTHTPFSWQQRDRQISIAEHYLEDYFLNSPDALRLEKYELAANILMPESPDVADRIGQQAARVEGLIESMSQLDSLTPADSEVLVRETTELVKLFEENGLGSGLWRYSAAENLLSARYDRNRPPPGISPHDLQTLNRDDYWQRTTAMSDLTPEQMIAFAGQVTTQLTGRARVVSLDHTDIFGTLPPNSPMRNLQAGLARAQTVPDNVDLDLAFQVNMTTAQLRLGEGDLKHYEYRLTDAARALLGDAGWGVHRDELFAALRWITGDAALSPEQREGSDEDVVPRTASEMQFVNAWNNTSREARIEYLGFDVETWNQVEPLLDQAYMAHRQRKAGEFTLVDVVKIGMAMFVSYATANTLGPAIAGWLSGSAGAAGAGAAGAGAAGAGAASTFTVSGAVGTAVGGAAGALVSTWIISGDWVTARESFKDVFEGDLKEGLAQVALNYFGLDTRYASIVSSATSDEVVDELTEQLGMDLLQRFGGPVIDGLKAYTPDVVDKYLEDLKLVLQATDDPEQIAEHAIGWWGAELSSMLGITNGNGITLVTSLLDTAVNTGDFDVAAMQKFLGEEVVEYFADIPAEVVERLGGRDSTLALLGGVAAQIVVNNLDVAVEGGSFMDAAKEEFEEFVIDIAENWVEQGGLESALSWLPGAENWSSDFRNLVVEGHASGWDKDELQSHLSESSLFANLVNSYIPTGFAHNMLARALQYASENGWDTQTIINSATIDMVEILANSGISQSIVNFLGGNGAILSQMSAVFGQRLIANDGDIDAALRDMEKYARGLAAGHVGDFAQSMLAQVLGPKAGKAIEALSGLVEGVAAGWSDEKIEEYIDQHILTPLGDTVGAMVTGAFGGKDNFIAGLLGAVADAYVTNPGDESAARGAAIDFLLSRLSALAGGGTQGSDALAMPTSVPSGLPSPFSLAQEVSDLVEFANANDWNQDAIEDYVEQQLLTGGLAGGLIETLLGSFGTPAQLAAVLVEELLAVYNATEDPRAVVEHFVSFLLNPPALDPADNGTGVVATNFDGTDPDMVIVNANYTPAAAAQDELRQLSSVPTQFPVLLSGFEQQLEIDRNALDELRQTGAPRAVRDKVEDSIEFLEGVLDEIGDLELNVDSLVPIKAVLIADEPGEAVPPSIQLQVYAHQTDDGVYQIVDLTNPLSAKVYSAQPGQGVDAAWQEFIDVNTLPAGQIAADPSADASASLDMDASDPLWSQHSDGENALGAASDGFGWFSLLSAGAGVLALVASPFTGGASLAAVPWLFGAAGVSGAASAGFNIAERLQSGSFDWFTSETALDLLGLAGGMTGGLMAALGTGSRVFGAASVSLRPLGSSNLVAISAQADNIAAGAGAIVIGADYLAEIDRINNDTSLSDSEKQAQTEEILEQALLFGAMMVVGTGLSKVNFGAAGITAGTRPAINPNTVGRPVNVVDSETNVSTTVANINDPPDISDGHVTKLNGETVKINEPRSYDEVIVNADGSRTFYKNGSSVTYGADGFPDFNSVQDVYLDPAIVLSRNSDDHFRAANLAMREALEADPGLAMRLGLDDDAVNHIMSDVPGLQRRSPPGYTWHHHENVGKMQLVARDEHSLFPSGHIGGQAIWAGAGQ